MTTVTGEVRDRNGDLLVDAAVHLYRRDTGALLESALTGDGSPAQDGDPEYDLVSMLLHFDGDNNSTSFIDSSGTPLTLSAAGGACLSTTYKKFGTASGYFDGSGDYVRISSDVSALKFITGTFCIEGQIYATGNTAAYQQVLTGGTSWSSGSGGLYWYGASNKLGCAWNHVATNPLLLSDELSLNTWHYFALCRDSSHMLRLFINDVLAASVQLDSSTELAVNNQNQTNLGGGGWDADFGGYLDELRVTKGSARYGSSVVPPTSAFPDNLAIPARPLGIYSIDTDYSGEVQRIVCAPDAWDPIVNDLIDRIILP